MIRKRLAALAVAGTVAFSGAALGAPAAQAQPELSSQEAVQMSAQSALDQVRNVFYGGIVLPITLSSMWLAFIAGPKYTCTALIPQFCLRGPE